MRRIDTTPYSVKPKLALESIEVKPFDLLEDILSAGTFNPKQLLDRMDLLRKVREFQAQPYVLVEESDYSTVKVALDSLNGYTSLHEEFIRRIYDAPTVPAV